MNDTVIGRVLPEELHHLALTGDYGVIEELVALFEKDVAHRLGVLRMAVTAGDHATVAAQAQNIKASAIQMGAHNLVTTCRHLELDAAHQVTENLERLLLEAEIELRTLATSMHRPGPLTLTAGRG